MKEFVVVIFTERAERYGSLYTFQIFTPEAEVFRGKKVGTFFEKVDRRLEDATVANTVASYIFAFPSNKEEEEVLDILEGVSAFEDGKRSTIYMSLGDDGILQADMKEERWY